MTEDMLFELQGKINSYYENEHKEYLENCGFSYWELHSFAKTTGETFVTIVGNFTIDGIVPYVEIMFKYEHIYLLFARYEENSKNPKKRNFTLKTLAKYPVLEKFLYDNGFVMLVRRLARELEFHDFESLMAEVDDFLVELKKLSVTENTNTVM